MHSKLNPVFYKCLPSARENKALFYKCCLNLLNNFIISLVVGLTPIPKGMSTMKNFVKLSFKQNGINKSYQSVTRFLIHNNKYSLTFYDFQGTHVTTKAVYWITWKSIPFVTFTACYDG